MRASLFRLAIMAGFAAALLLMAASPGSAQAAVLKFQIVLVWASDTNPPAGKAYKPLEPQIRKQVKALKWKNYFEVKRIDFEVTPGGSKKVAISDKCELDLKDLGNSNVEVAWFGKGKEVARVKQKLPIGDILVPAGDAPNETAWLAILRRVE
jgi:hypothetical protein